MIQDPLPVGENMYLLFNSNIVNLLLKTKWGRNRRPYFVLFLVSSVLIVGRWGLVAWSRKPCLGPAGIAYFVFLDLFNDERRRGESRISFLLFLKLIKGTRRRSEFKILLLDTREGFLLDLLGAIKNWEYVLEVGCWGMFR